MVRWAWSHDQVGVVRNGNGIEKEREVYARRKENNGS